MIPSSFNSFINGRVQKYFNALGSFFVLENHTFSNVQGTKQRISFLV